MLKRTVLTIGTIAVVTLSSALFTDAVHAQQTLDEVNAKQQEVKSKLSKAESQIADILYEIKEVNDELARLQSALEQNQAQIEKTEKEIDALQEEIDALNEKIEQRNEKLKERLAAYQENGGNIQFIEVLLGAKDPFEFLSRVDAVTTITNADLELIEDNERDKATVEEKLAEQEELVAELEAQKETINDQKEQEEASKKKLKEKEDKLQSQKANLESESSDLATLESEIRAEMEAAAAAAAAAVAQSTSDNVANDTGSSNTNNGNATSNNVSNSGNSSNSNSGNVSVPTPAPSGGGGGPISKGRSVIGTPYVWGGAQPGGFDCSGFISWAHGMGRQTTDSLKNMGTKVDASNMQPGDLVFFDTYKTNGHVGIYTGGGKFLAANSSRGVEEVSMTSGYWAGVFKGHVRRVN
ncbi:C40 family peptidase [Pseudogracilibacillus auburnensis]|nr:C40 family peptidase [Pseudogracilibacillus auburnensis]